MSSALSRRLDRLESTMSATGGVQLAEASETGRALARTSTPEEMQQRGEVRLAEMQQRHAVAPLRGLEHRMMEGLDRVWGTRPPIPDLPSHQPVPPT